MKVPAIIACSIISLAVGLLAGAVGATYYSGELTQLWARANPVEGPAGDQKAPDVKAMQKGGMGMGMGGKGPSAKSQLNTLVAKLDILTQKPLTVNLDDAQKKQVQEQLKGLDALDELTEADAKQRLDALLEVVKDQKEQLSVVGFRWPGEKGGGFGGAKDVPNPFKEEPNAKRLQALEQRLGKTTS